MNSEISTLLLLIGLELVLGIDNVLLISILSSRVEESKRRFTRLVGLTAAFLARIVLLFGAAYLTKMTDHVFLTYSAKDLILILGGCFLLYKAVKEIHHAVEVPGGPESKVSVAKSTVASVVTQILILDMVFSIDSVITAVGLTDHMLTIIVAVVVSFIIVLFFANSIARFVEVHPALKVLALSFLICIGATLVVEGLHGHVPKAYLYLPMGFALAVELLQMRQAANRKS